MKIEEAINILTQKENIDLSNHFNNTKFFEAIYTLLRAYEKQSKEIEELKEDSCCMTNCVRRDKEKLFLEDKIKAKIEEYKEKCKNCNFRGKICKEFTKNYNCTIAVCLNEFYSFLNKEMGDK